MARKQRVNPELEITSDNEGVISEPETTDNEPEMMDDELEAFKLSIAQMDNEMLSRYRMALDGEIEQRQKQEMEKVLQFVKTLSKENQELFLNSIQSTVFKRELSSSDDERRKEKKEKNPFRMYQNYPSDENPEYKIAPLVNVELKEVFTGGNPNNKTWLANLPIEERHEHFGTIKKLEADPSFLNELMTVPKAVFKLENGNWVDCYKE